MWNSGMTFRQRSSAVSASEVLILPAEAATLAWVSGTILGRDVVPDVCRISAMSSGPGAEASAGVPVRSEVRRNAPAGAPWRRPPGRLD